MKNRVVFCLVAAFLGGLAFAFGDLLIPQENLHMEAASRPEEFARFVTHPNHALSALRGLVGVFCEMLGALGIYLLLKETKQERLAFWGLVLFLVNVATGHALFALLYFMFPALGELYLRGTEAATTYAAMTGDLAVFMTIGLLVWIVGALLLAGAIWRSGALPRWSGVLMLAGFLLVPAPGTFAQVAANLTWGSAFLWMAWSVRSG